MGYNAPMRVSFLCVALALGGLIVTGAEGVAAAQAKPDYEAAKKHYTNAKDAEARGDYDTAVSEYAAAYDITKDPKLLYRIARAYEAGGNKDAAVVYYRRYINEAKDAKDRDEVKAKIAELEGQKSGPVETPPPGGGGTETGTGTGTGGGGNELVQPDLGGGEGGGEGGGGEGPSFVESGGGRWQRTAGWVSVGVAAVALTTGAVLGESARSHEEDIDRLIDYRDPQDMLPTKYQGTVKDDYEDATSDGDRDEKLAIVAFSIAGVAAVAATVFFLMDPGPAETTDTAKVKGKGKGVAKAKKKSRLIAPTPVFGPDGVGITTGWRF
jgi:tetratricopeptide (TPR) repeat protein